MTCGCYVIGPRNRKSFQRYFIPAVNITTHNKTGRPQRLIFDPSVGFFKGQNNV